MYIVPGLEACGVFAGVTMWGAIIIGVICCLGHQDDRRNE